MQKKIRTQIRMDNQRIHIVTRESGQAERQITDVENFYEFIAFCSSK